jgi:glucosamine--fructose-6-phosphate aminotransferase (isomerizing)
MVCAAPVGPGHHMRREMAEQPRVLANLLGRAGEVRDLVRSVAPRPLQGIALAARGSSDHASVTGRFALELSAHRPVSLVAPSLHVLYGAQVDYRGILVIATSQSGQTPEITRTMQHLRAAGARGLAITNDANSPLAEAADAVLELGAGEELAVPATKTVTAEMLSYLLIADALGDGVDGWDRLPGAVDATLGDAASARRAAAALAGESRLLVTARGLLYGAALETALKLQETAAVAASALSSADLRHGPIAMIDRDFRVIALSAPGPANADMSDIVITLRRRGARLVTVSDASSADLPIPAVSEPLAAILAVIRGQQLAHELALAHGRDPDAPAGLSKVTRT